MVFGYVVITFVYGMAYGGLMAFVDDFFARRRSVDRVLGTAALAAACDACARLGVRAMVEVAGDNDPALAVYRRTGFEMTDRKLMVLAWAGPRTSSNRGEIHRASESFARSQPC